ADAVLNLAGRLQAVGDTVLEVRPDGRAALVRKAEMPGGERGLELVLVLDDDRAGDGELLGENRHLISGTRGRREKEHKAAQASRASDGGRPRGDSHAVVIRRNGPRPVSRPVP